MSARNFKPLCVHQIRSWRSLSPALHLAADPWISKPRRKLVDLYSKFTQVCFAHWIYRFAWDTTCLISYSLCLETQHKSTIFSYWYVARRIYLLAFLVPSLHEFRICFNISIIFITLQSKCSWHPGWYIMFFLRGRMEITLVKVNGCTLRCRTGSGGMRNRNNIVSVLNTAGTRRRWLCSSFECANCRNKIKNQDYL